VVASVISCLAKSGSPGAALLPALINLLIINKIGNHITMYWMYVKAGFNFSLIN